jgi:stage III sporulation protein AA
MPAFRNCDKHLCAFIYFNMNEPINTGWKEILGCCLPEHIFFALRAVDEGISQRIEEIRLRTGRPLMVYTGEKGFCVGAGGSISDTSGITVTSDDMERTFGAVTGKSAYAYENELKQGFLTLSGGIRAGFAGSAVIQGGAIKTYRGISGVNFRIPCHASGICTQLLPYISKRGQLKSTLILSAPKLGKTTLARDIARSAGSGIGLIRSKVTVIDERQELAAAEYGEPLFDVGTETDVISNVNKAEGVFMALRALSPDVIVTDEIGRNEDLEALREVANTGVVMVTTAHAPDLASLLERFFFKRLFEEGMFEAYVALSASLGRITVEQVYDARGQGQLSAPMRLEAV